jgi:hypothetical protein
MLCYARDTSKKPKIYSGYDIEGAIEYSSALVGRSIHTPILNIIEDRRPRWFERYPLEEIELGASVIYELRKENHGPESARIKHITRRSEQAEWRLNNESRKEYRRLAALSI